VTGLWFSPGTSVPPPIKLITTNITKILLKLALNTIKKTILYFMFILLTKGLIGTFI
jgi:hypothetical protein